MGDNTGLSFSDWSATTRSTVVSEACGSQCRPSATVSNRYRTVRNWKRMAKFWLGQHRLRCSHGGMEGLNRKLYLDKITRIISKLRWTHKESTHRTIHQSSASFRYNTKDVQTSRRFARCRAAVERQTHCWSLPPLLYSFCWWCVHFLPNINNSAIRCTYFVWIFFSKNTPCLKTVIIPIILLLHFYFIALLLYRILSRSLWFVTPVLPRSPSIRSPLHRLHQICRWVHLQEWSMPRLAIFGESPSYFLLKFKSNQCD